MVTNADIEKIVDTNDEWIRSRTGILERHYAAPGVGSSDLGTEAAKKLLAAKGVPASEIELIVVATVTPDMFFPATACLIQDRIGAKHAWGFDLSGACSGFLYALTTGAQFVGAGTHKKAMVVGADVMTSILDFKDRATCVLVGDGAGAVKLLGAGRLLPKKASSISRTILTVREVATCTCRRAVRSIPPRRRRSTSACTTCTRRGQQNISNTRCAG